MAMAEGAWHRRGALVAVLVVSLAIGYGYGVLSQRYELFPYHHLGWLLHGDAFKRLAAHGGYDVTAGRPRVSCRSVGAHSLVLVTLGQSNSANAGAGPFGTSAGVYNFNLLDGRCYEARDPLLGAGGRGGSVWMPLARQIVESELAASVIVAPIGLGGTRVEGWAPGGALSGRITGLLESMEQSGLPVHAILWHQGESDHATGRDAYEAAFLAMVRAIRGAGWAAPVYVARATRCGDSVSPSVRAAQTELGIRFPSLGLRPGPDTDVLVGSVWREGCHFTHAGLVRHAGLWYEVLAGDIPGLLARSRK
ncbi:MAG: sialate O-acetylesterase [Steroidobacteraceae bacterium]